MQHKTKFKNKISDCTFQLQHQCSSQTDWQGCSSEDVEIFFIIPISTRFINISGTDCELDKGNNGLREIEIWSP